MTQIRKTRNAKTVPQSSFLRELETFKKHKVAAALGCAIGPAMPVFSYYLAHHKAPTNAWFWLLVAPFLAASGATVWQNLTKIMGGGRLAIFKAGVFTVACEIVIACVSDRLVYWPLGILALFNAISFANYLVNEGRKVRK